MEIRKMRREDHRVVSPKLNEWWGGRQMSSMMPRLFFDHFHDTGFIIEEDHTMVGFLVGFLSQSEPDEAYIHFVGVAPEYRERHIGRQLYETFFHKAMKEGRAIVRAITSPVNKASIAYHKKMGFEIQSGDGVIDGIPVSLNYDGEGGHRVLFKKVLNQPDG
ncbi:hypothetical protein SAMN04487936_103333 [Halobacillus dabanensis]|uniref:N-acetyltransferase domain-containing protein n=1 Tax=Halobacillus dabanensis TaxID=240302 RepID=A0A1I3TE95_HALDA|nr:GNAT family N-acetyltransferase [Halobacillus dabanensis]SFJ68769.1 hypothetical protein SAMN04487936_103333 [Halobacillus dabanensis]